VCSDGRHVEYQDCIAVFTEDASLKDGERGSLEPLKPSSGFAVCQEGRQEVVPLFLIFIISLIV